MDYFWEKFMRITYNSAYDILGTVQPDNENLIRIWIIWIQKVSILEIAPFSHFNRLLNFVVFQNVLIIGGYREMVVRHSCSVFNLVWNPYYGYFLGQGLQ